MLAESNLLLHLRALVMNGKASLVEPLDKGLDKSFDDDDLDGCYQFHLLTREKKRGGIVSRISLIVPKHFVKLINVVITFALEVD